MYIVQWTMDKHLNDSEKCNMDYDGFTYTTCTNYNSTIDNY